MLNSLAPASDFDPFVRPIAAVPGVRAEDEDDDLDEIEEEIEEPIEPVEQLDDFEEDDFDDEFDDDFEEELDDDELSGDSAHGPLGDNGAIGKDDFDDA